MQMCSYADVQIGILYEEYLHHSIKYKFNYAFDY